VLMHIDENPDHQPGALRSILLPLLVLLYRIYDSTNNESFI
jgi:hypothetical protein